MNMLKTSLEYWIPSCYRGYDHSMHDSTFLRSFQGYKRLYFVSGTRLCPVSQQTISLLSQHFFLWKRTAWLCRVVNYLLRRGSLSRAVGVNDPSRLTLHHNYIKRRWNVLKICHKALLIFSMLYTKTCCVVNILQHINLYNKLHSHMWTHDREHPYRLILHVWATRKFTAPLFSKNLPFIS